MALLWDPSIHLCSIPAGPPPNNTLPNFENPATLGPSIIAIGVTLGTTSTLLTVGRLYSNSRKLHSADWFTLAACIFNIAFTGTICATHRIYRHQWDVPACWYTPKTLQLSFAQTILYAPVFFFCKAAILLLYKQLFAINKRIRRIVDVGLFVTALTYFSNIPLAAVYMAPRAGGSWEEMLLTVDEWSLPLGIAGVTQSAVGTLIDFYIFFLPLPFLLRLHLPMKRVLGLVSIFSTALLGVGASVVSLFFKRQLLSSTDTTWLAALASMCCLIETNIAIIVGCTPAFASFATNTIAGSAFFKSLRSRLLGSRMTSPSSKKDGRGVKTGGTSDQVGVYGERQTPRHNSYYKLSDTNTLITSKDRPIGSREYTPDEEHEMRSELSSIRQTDESV